MANKSEVIQILDVLFDDTSCPPDLNIVANIAAGSSQPIALMCAVVQLLWMSGEVPEEFDKAVESLYS